MTHIDSLIKTTGANIGRLEIIEPGSSEGFGVKVAPITMVLCSIIASETSGASRLD